jgi:hypothetical protein
MTSQKSQSSPRHFATLSLTILAGVIATLVGILGNIATSNIPPFLKPYLDYAWPAFGSLAVLGIALTVWQTWRTTTHSSPTQKPMLPSAIPPVVSPTTSSISPYYSCVLSYATENEDFAQKLYTDLRQRGVPCWFAPQDLKMGDMLRDTIYKAIDKKDKLLLVLSEHAIRSKWIEEEVNVALDREHLSPGTFLLFPIRLDDQVMHTKKAWAIAVRQRYIGDFHQWNDNVVYEKALNRLTNDLKI